MFNNPVTNSLWVEKYRPSTLAEYVGSEDLKDTMAKYVEANDIPHLLFHARAGTGKTTLGNVLTNAIDCDVLKLNASDENSIETIRNKIKTFVSTVGFKKWKVVFLDEADYLTINAQAVLRNLMEQFSKTSRFIMTCNYPEKILDPIRSRCTVFEVLPPNKKDVALRLVEILKAEGVDFEMKDVGVIVNNNYPDLRRVISSAQSQVQNGKLKLTKKQVLEVNYLGKILDVLKSTSPAKNMYKDIRQIIADSKVRMFEDLYRFLFDHIDDFAPEGTQAACIIEIAKAQRDGVHVVDQEINVIAMFVEIIGHIQNK